MEIFKKLSENDHEKVVFVQDKKSGLKGIIAIHSTKLGPAIGGCRVKKYDSEEEALNDVLRLSRGMTYKNAAAHLDFGGAKSVIMIDDKNPKTPHLLQSFATFVNKLGGIYLLGKDVGVSDQDISLMTNKSKYILGAKFHPSKYTADGVLKAIEASAYYLWKSNDLKNKVVAIQGIGAVGYELAKMLFAKGAKLIVCDPNQEMIQKAKEELNAEVVDLDNIYDVECDIFAPCALGQTINVDTIKRLKTKIIAGSANNQLQNQNDAELLQAKNILYAPDYVVNSGGVIAVACEYLNQSREQIIVKINAIYGRVLEIYDYAKKHKMTTHQASEKIVENYIEKMSLVINE